MKTSKIRILIKHCFLIKKKYRVNQKMVSFTISGIVEKWFFEFKCGRTSIEDATCSSRPNGAVLTQTIKKVLKFAGLKRTLREVVETLKISKEVGVGWGGFT